MHVLVTGGAGYIGSHTCLALLEADYEVTVLDSLCNGSVVALERVQELAGKELSYIHGDIRNEDLLRLAFRRQVDAVIHFAALKSVHESYQDPLRYFDNNVGGTITLLKALNENGVGRFVFSSSATVYGEPSSIPVKESSPLCATSPYGRTKLVMEEIVRDYISSKACGSAVLLRYFNPAGAHPSGRIGEDPGGVPNNLMPYVAQVAVGRRERLRIYGGDYPTADGTGVRDYIHVMDLADAHVRALEFSKENLGSWVFNIGAGKGYSVLELVKAFEEASGRKIKYEIAGRRRGDIAEIWADTTLASRVLGWRAKRDLADICRDVWKWQRSNPEGYRAHGVAGRKDE